MTDKDSGWDEWDTVPDKEDNDRSSTPDQQTPLADDSTSEIDETETDAQSEQRSTTDQLPSEADDKAFETDETASGTRNDHWTSASEEDPWSTKESANSDSAVAESSTDTSSSEPNCADSSKAASESSFEGFDTESQNDELNGWTRSQSQSQSSPDSAGRSVSNRSDGEQGDEPIEDLDGGAQFTVPLALYTSEGEPVDTPAEKELSADPSIRRYFDDDLEVLFEVNDQTDSIDVTCHVRARSFSKGRLESYYVRFEHVPGKSGQDVQRQLHQFLTEYADLTLSYPNNVEETVFDLIWSVSSISHLPEQTLATLGTVLGEELDCASLYAPDVKTALELALYLLSETDAQTLAISRTDNYLDKSAHDIKILLREERSVELDDQTEKVLAQYRDRLMQEAVDERFDAISDEINRLQQETDLDDVRIHQGVVAELPDVSRTDRLLFRAAQFRQQWPGRKITNRISRWLPSRKSTNPSNPEVGQVESQPLRSQDSIVFQVLSLRRVVTLFGFLILTTLAGAGYMMWAGRINLGSITGHLIWAAKTYLPNAVVAWIPLPMTDLLVALWVLSLPVFICLCLGGIWFWFR